jgi:NADH-quinone oxidoreductase subunit E
MKGDRDVDVRSQLAECSEARWHRFPHSPESIIPLLQEVQHETGYVSEAGLARVAEHARAPMSTVYGVATFYSQFRMQRPGAHTIRVCEGTACHVLGANDVMGAFRELLGVDIGGTTADGLFTLESVRCLGCCSLAPAVMIDAATYGRVTRAQITKILSNYRKDAR